MNGVLELIKRYPIAIICSLLTLVGAALIFMRGDVLDSLHAEEEQLAARFAVLDRNTKNSKNIAEDLEQLELSSAAIEGLLFDRKKRAINTNFFYSFADGLDVEITQVSQKGQASDLFAKSGPHELSLHSAISYDITAIGKYADLLEFLHQYFVVDAIARVSGFRLAHEAGDLQGQPQLRLDMQVMVLSKKD